MANPDEAPETPLLRIPYEGEIYELYARDLTTARLRQLKVWYGAAYGAYLRLIQMLMEFDADAIIGGLWIAMTKAGKQVDPKLLDFAPSDMIPLLQLGNGDDDSSAAEESPTTAAQPALDTPTPASSGTASTSSDPSTSSTSPTSADSAPETSTTSGSSTS